MKVVKEYETLRVYGKIVNRWRAYDEQIGREITTQVEVEYEEYDRDGTLIGKGTEDFSKARWNDQVRDYILWGWDGKTRNKGGHKWFRSLFLRTINRKDVWKLRQVTAAWYKEYEFAEIEARAL